MVFRFKGMAFSFAYWLWWRWLAHVQFNGQDAWMVKLMDPFYAEQDGWNRERFIVPMSGLRRGENIVRNMRGQCRRLSARRMIIEATCVGRREG